MANNLSPYSAKRKKKKENDGMAGLAGWLAFSVSSPSHGSIQAWAGGSGGSLCPI